jgi:hypothetical protein
LIKGGEISALLSFVSFSKLVILVYTGQPVENNTAYARYNKDHIPALLQISVYLDGLYTNQNTGYSYAIYFGPILVSKGLGPAGLRTEIYNAEIMGAVEGLHAALQQYYTSYSI